MSEKVKSTLSLRFKVKPGSKEDLLKELRTILDLCAKEPEFVTAFVCESKEEPNELAVFEIWKGTTEEFMETQGEKPYRATYLENSKKFVDQVDIHWNTPILEWGSNLLSR